MDASDFWNLLKTIAGIGFMVLVCLYAIRCFTAGQLISLDQFDVFVRALIRHIFSL